MTLLFAFVSVILGPYLYRRVPIHFYPAISYVLKYLGGQLFDFERVRYAIMFQLAVLSVLMILAIIKEGAPVLRESPFDLAFSRLSILFLLYVGLCTCWGVFSDNAVSQVVVDSYKFLEIPVLYTLFRISWRNTGAVRHGLTALSVIMLALGLVEIFVTERGGVGLNLIISIFPMTLLLLEKADKKRCVFMLLLLATSIVLLSKTRTYIIAFLLMLLLLVLFSPSGLRFGAASRVALMFLMFLVVDFTTGGRIFAETAARFLELSRGFEVAGGYRAAEISVAIPFMRSHFLLGSGLGFVKTLYIEGMGVIDWGGFIHNAYVEVFLKTGILGSIAAALLTISLFILIGGNAKLSAVPNSAEISLICRGAIISATSWLLIYATAPVSTFGSIFLGPLIAVVSIKCFYDCQNSGSVRQ